MSPIPLTILDAELGRITSYKEDAVSISGQAVYSRYFKDLVRGENRASAVDLVVRSSA